MRPAFCGLVLAILAAASVAQESGLRRQLEITGKFDRIVHVDLGRERMVDEGLFDDIRREIERAEAGGPAALILEIDSGGGMVYWAQQIVALIRSYRESDRLRIYAYVPHYALSAAAWISLSCRGLFIAPDATIGNIQPIEAESGAWRLAPGKLVSSLTEELVVTCRDNGIEPRYPRLFLEAMVDRDIAIVAVRETAAPDRPPRFMRSTEFDALPPRERDGLDVRYISAPGKALSTNGSDLIDFGFSVRLVKNAAQIADFAGTANVTIERRQVAGTARFGVHLDWSLALLVIGIILLVMEFKTPGFGVFGIGGVAAMLIFFGMQAGWESSAILPIAVFLLGAFLVMVEVAFLPGFILPGLIGFLAMLYATWVAIAHPGFDGIPPFPDLDDKDDRRALMIWSMSLIGSLIGGASFTLTFGKMLHRLPVLGRMVMRPGTLPSAAPREAAVGTAAGAPAVGALGTTLTDLRPSGIALIDGKKRDVVSIGDWIERGREIRVVEVAGNRIVVRTRNHEETA